MHTLIFYYIYRFIIKYIFRADPVFWSETTEDRFESTFDSIPKFLRFVFAICIFILAIFLTVVAYYEIGLNKLAY